MEKVNTLGTGIALAVTFAFLSAAHHGQTTHQERE